MQLPERPNPNSTQQNYFFVKLPVVQLAMEFSVLYTSMNIHNRVHNSLSLVPVLS